MAQLIKAAMPSDKEQKKKFKNALMGYISQAGIANHAFNQTLLDSVFDQHLKESVPQKTFKKLTLSELIRIVKNLWPTYQADFKDMPWDVVGPLLDDVRKTRNVIAHFDEVTDQQRKQLQFCADFLNNHRLPPKEADTTSYTTYSDFLSKNFDFVLPSLETRTSKDFLITVGKFLARVQENRTEASEKSAESASYYSPEEVESNDSRYAPLAIWLQAQEDDRVTYTFKEIESIIGEDLPSSARQNRSWWANDTSHTQSIQWLEVGWRVSSVNMSTERVVFSRMGDRQSAYIEFFNQLQIKLQSIQNLSIQPQNSPQGRNWLELAVSPKDDRPSGLSQINFAFTRRSRFRIETYINEREQNQNKQIFDYLKTQETEIETDFGAALSWERLNHRHGSRIAHYRANSSITDEAEKLAEIQQWAVETLPKFYAALSDRFIAAKKEVISQADH